MNSKPDRNIGLAIAALLCATASAQAQTTPASSSSTVTIYGLLDVSVAYATTPGGRIVKLDSGHAKGSRLGFRGTEDLGGGLRANVLLESGINADTGANGVLLVWGLEEFPFRRCARVRARGNSLLHERESHHVAVA